MLHEARYYIGIRTTGGATRVGIRSLHASFVAVARMYIRIIRT